MLLYNYFFGMYIAIFFANTSLLTRDIHSHDLSTKFKGGILWLHHQLKRPAQTNRRTRVLTTAHV